MKFLFNIILLQFFTILLYSQGIIVTSGAEIEFAGNPYFIIRDGGLSNNGTVTSASENTYFTGTVESSLTGSSLTLNNIRVENTSGIIDSISSLSCANLEIVSGGVFKISPVSQLSISSNLINNGGNAGLTLQSSEDGMASLIANNGVSFSAERYMTGNRWHFVSPIASGETLVNFLSTNTAIPANGETRAMTRYDESTGGYLAYFTNSTGGNLSASYSYLIRTSSDANISFRGNMQSTDASISITDNNRGWNSIGNPFSSSVMISEDAHSTDNFLSYNSTYLDPSYNAIYIWDEQDNYSNKNRNDFVAINHLSSLDYLQPGQGFMVKSVSGGATAYFNANMRSHGTQAFYKKSASQKTQIKLHISDEENEAYTQIYFVNNATTGLDPGYDAGLYGSMANFSLYSQLLEDTGEKFMIQALPDNAYENLSIPIGLDCAEESLITFKAELVSFAFEIPLFLEDRERNIFTDLKLVKSTYTANVPAGTEGIGRFYLHTFDASTVGIDGSAFSSLQIYSIEKEILIKGNIPENSNFYIYDLMGRTLKIINLPADSNTSIQVPNLSTGVYIVRISDGKSEETQRVFIR